MPASCMEEESPSAQTVQLCDEMQLDGTLKRSGTPPRSCPGPKRQALGEAKTAQSGGAGDMIQEDLTTRPLVSALPSQRDPFEGHIGDEFDEADQEYAQHVRCARWHWGAHTGLSCDAESIQCSGFRALPCTPGALVGGRCSSEGVRATNVHAGEQHGPPAAITWLKHVDEGLPPGPSSAVSSTSAPERFAARCGGGGGRARDKCWKRGAQRARFGG